MEAGWSRFLALVEVAEIELSKLKCCEKGLLVVAVHESKRAAPSFAFSGFPKRKRTQISRKKRSAIAVVNPIWGLKSEFVCQLDGLKLKIIRKMPRVAEDEAQTLSRPNKIMKLEPPSLAETFNNLWDFSKPSHLGGKTFTTLSMEKEMEKSDSKSVASNWGSTLREKKQRAEKEQQAVEKEVDELLSWTDMIEHMDETQLKNYLKNRPKPLKTAKKENLGKRRLVKERCRKSGSSGIMAAVWKFHKEGDGGSF